MPYVEMSSILADDPAGISDSIDGALLLGWDGPSRLIPCAQTAARGGSEGFARRLVVDAQYANEPRCCDASEVPLLTARNTSILQSSGLATIMEHRFTHGVEYVRISPPLGVCSAESPCPLVIQLPERTDMEIIANIGNPWILMQGHCRGCHDELRAVLVAPSIPYTLLSAVGHKMGADSKIVRTKLVPLVEALLRDNVQLDANRVYLVAQGPHINTAIRAAVERPDLFAAGFFSGMFHWSYELLDSLNRTASVQASDMNTSQGLANPSKMKVMTFHMGDLDKSIVKDDFFASLKRFTKSVGSVVPFVDIRVYPKLGHAVWYATWNSLHEVIWTAQRYATSIRVKTPTTCPSKNGV